MKATHTPGPFIATVPPSSAHRFRYIEAVREDGPNVVVAEIIGLPESEGETKTSLANTNLFVASADLYEALKNITDCYGVGYRSPEQFCKDVHDFMLAGRAAVVKAGGRA